MQQDIRPLEQTFFSEYERGLLSVVYRNTDLLIEVGQRITSDYFLYQPHRIIYTALNLLISNDKIQKIDLETLTIECDKFNIRSFGVGPEYLALLTSGGFDRDNFEFYYEKVKSSYLKYAVTRSLEDNYNTVIKNAKDSEECMSAEDLISKAQADLAVIQTNAGTLNRGVELSSRVRDFVVEKAQNPSSVRGLATGLKTLDEAINGLMPGTLTIIAGIAKSGKSALLLNIANHIAIQSRIDAILSGKPDPSTPVLYISTEMNTDEDLSRLVAMRSLVSERQISNGTAYNDPKTRSIIDVSISEIETSNIIHEYLPAFNASSVANLIQYYKLRYNVGLVIFDYIKMDTVGDGLKNKREDQILGDLTIALKNTAGRLGIPIISACQINTRTMRVADSDRIVRYCNTLLEFKPKDFEELQEQPFREHGTHWLSILYTRAGGSGKIPIRFWKHCIKMEEAEVYEGPENAEEDLANQDLLTTPREWEAMNSSRFDMSQVVQATELKDATDLVETEDDKYF